MEIFVVKVFGGCTRWFSDADVLAVYCTQTMVQIPPLRESVGNTQPLFFGVGTLNHVPQFRNNGLAHFEDYYTTRAPSYSEVSLLAGIVITCTKKITDI